MHAYIPGEMLDGIQVSIAFHEEIVVIYWCTTVNNPIGISYRKTLSLTSVLWKCWWTKQSTTENQLLILVFYFNQKSKSRLTNVCEGKPCCILASCVLGKFHLRMLLLKCHHEILEHHVEDRNESYSYNWWTVKWAFSDTISGPMKYLAYWKI